MDHVGTVQRYVASWHEAWESAAESDEPDAAWRRLAQASSGELSDVAWPEERPDAPCHVPGRERVVDQRVEGARAFVHTKLRVGDEARFYAYTLDRGPDDTWRITALETRNHAFAPLAGSPRLLNDVARAAFLEQVSPTAALTPLPEAARPLGHRAFERGVEVGGVSIERHEEVGRLELASGRIGVDSIHDGILSLQRTRPLLRSVTPGAYPVRLSWGVAHGTELVVAARLVLDERPPTQWWLAPSASSEGLADVAEDGATVIFDADALLKMTEFDQESMAERIAEHEEAGATFFALQGDQDALALRTGFYGRSAPCYWGTDDDGQLVCLQVEIAWDDPDDTGFPF